MTPADRALLGRARVSSWLALPALLALQRVAPRVTTGAAALAVGTVGVSHGANDDRILHRLLPRFPGGRVGISCAYGATAIGVLIAALRAPRTAERALGALSWFHFGSGDLAFAQAAHARRPLVIDGALRGIIPLTGRTDGARAVLAYGLAASAALGYALRGDGANALDHAIPALVLAVAPAPLGFACYFGYWHSVRHLALVLARDSQGGQRLVRFAREAARNVLLAGALGAIVYSRVPKDQYHRAFVALTLGVTVPHQIVVWYAQLRAVSGDVS